ncbi:MAG: STAS domain-containing protein [Planctomycetota bacterium]|jgi:anti-anti-sigma factor
MEISQLEASDGVLEFALAGDVVQNFVNPTVTSQFADVSGEPVFDRQVLLNVSDVTFLDSNGIGWFVALDSQFRKGGGMLRLHSPSPVLQRIFSMMKMTTVIAVSPNRNDALSEAIASLAGRPETVPAPQQVTDQQAASEVPAAADVDASVGSSEPAEDHTADQVESGETA